MGTKSNGIASLSVCVCKRESTRQSLCEYKSVVPPEPRETDGGYALKSAKGNKRCGSKVKFAEYIRRACTLSGQFVLA